MGLLVMSFGTARKPEDIEAYYTHIRGGRKPSDELLQDLTDRFEKIGGTSPLMEISDKQGKALETELNKRQSDIDFKLYFGFLHVSPFIPEAIQQMADDGITEAVSIVLAPQYSAVSMKFYNDEAKEKAAEVGIHLTQVETWYKEPEFIENWSSNLTKTLSEIPADEQDKTAVIFTAHSIPLHVANDGDPYVGQIKATADLIAEKAGLTAYYQAWQSAGRTPFPWIGPDVQEFTETLYNEKGFTHFVYCPVSFVADHLEVLFDNDYECKVVCDKLGVHYHRPEMPNHQPKFISALATAVEHVL